MKTVKMTVREALKNEKVDYRSFYQGLMDASLGYWDGVNSKETILMYINDMVQEGVLVWHMLKAVQENPTPTEDYVVWLGNSMLTPEPIYTKLDLLNGLGLDEDEDEVINVKVEQE